MTEDKPNGQMKLTRDVPISECHWLDQDMNAGEIVYRYTGCTYGCISYTGLAVTRKPDEPPFFEIPLDALWPAP